MIVWSLFIIDLMGLFFYTKIGSIISIGDLPTTNIIEPYKETEWKRKINKIDILSSCNIIIHKNRELVNRKEAI